MRLSANMSQDEVRVALSSAAIQVWGPDKLGHRGSVIEQATKAIWNVLRVPMLPLSEEPDWQTPPSSLRGED